uniref:Uncharacterized protein n=1 Tax=Tanacetum cinerariifolium TaxID=118510 RepID=A0A699IR55_TANCI|nr:hypothetical protein [Tanacetum cinerariifolium]
MALTFADTHNMIAYVIKSDASEGFEQILYFLNASVINYALTVNLTIYVLITDDTIHQALQLNDAESIDCLPNEELQSWQEWDTRSLLQSSHFISLVRNVDSSSKFYMYPRFIQLMIATQVGDLTSHTTKYSSPALIQNVFASMRMVGKGFSGVNTPLFEGMLVQQQAADDVVDDDDIVDDVANVVAHVVAEPTPPSPRPAITPPPS